MIAGLVGFDGAAASVEGVARMIAPTAPRMLEVRGPVCHGSAALAYSGRRNRGGACDQPLVDPQSHCAIVFDGRIDNGADLAAWLGLDRCPRRSDARLMLAAYVARGTPAIGRGYGDFAVASW